MCDWVICEIQVSEQSAIVQLCHFIETVDPVSTQLELLQGFENSEGFQSCSNFVVAHLYDLDTVHGWEIGQRAKPVIIEAKKLDFLELREEFGVFRCHFLAQDTFNDQVVELREG